MAKEYDANNIEVLSLPEHVRRRPQLYFQDILASGTLDALPFEMACHAIDEYFDGNCRKLEVLVAEDHFELRYDAGMPLDEHAGECRAILIMTALFACRNEKKHLAVGEKFCSVGMAVVNAAAERCELQTVAGEQSGEFHFEQGILNSKRFTEAQGKADFTSIKCVPDKALLESLAFSLEGIEAIAAGLRAELEKMQMVVRAADRQQ